VTTSVWRRAEPGARLRGSWPTVRSQLRRIRGSREPVTRAISTSVWSFSAEGVIPALRGGENAYRFGKGLDTRGANGVYFLRLLENARNDGTVLVANTPEAGRIRGLPVRQGRVDAALVWPPRHRGAGDEHVEGGDLLLHEERPELAATGVASRPSELQALGAGVSRAEQPRYSGTLHLS